MSSIGHSFAERKASGLLIQDRGFGRTGCARSPEPKWRLVTRLLKQWHWS